MSWRRRRRRKPRRSRTSTVEIVGERAIQASKRKRKKKRVIGKGNPTPSLKNRRPSLNPVIPGREGRGKVRFLSVEIENTNRTRARAILNLRKIKSFRKNQGKEILAVVGARKVVVVKEEEEKGAGIAAIQKRSRRILMR
jgi:hypothetical protein